MIDTTTRIAAAKGLGSRLFVPNGVADGFRGVDGIDDSLSSNYIQNLAGGAVSPDDAPSLISQGEGADMGSFSAAGGFAAARNGVPNETYTNCARTTANTGSIGRNYTGGKRVARVVIRASSDYGFDGTGSATAIDIVLRARNGTPANHSDGVNLGSWSGADANGLVVVIDSSDIDTLYERWWAQITSSAGGVHLAVAEIEFYEPAASDDMTLAGQPVTADMEPDTAHAVLIVRPIDELTLNTDLTLELSRDDGETWADATLTQRHTLGFDRYCDAIGVDLSGQPSGSDIVWRVKTFNGKKVEVRGIDVSWEA